MPRPLYAPPPSADALVAFQDDVHSIQALRNIFLNLEHRMGYHRPNILWGMLAMSNPIQLQDNQCVYRINLPKPVYLSGGYIQLVGGLMTQGYYTGCVSLRLGDNRFAPVFTSMYALPAIVRREPHPDGVAGCCEVTLCLENLRPIEIKPVEDHSPAPFVDPVDLEYVWNSLRDMKRSVVRSLTSLLHPDEHSPDLTHPLF